MFDSWFRTTNEITANNKIMTREISNKLLIRSPELSTNTSSKVPPTVKATSVNVIVDDHNSTLEQQHEEDMPEMTPPEPYRSASISLSIELAKKNSIASINTTKNIMQKPDSITPQSSLPKYSPLHHNRPPSIQSSSNSLLQRMAHSPKAVAATFPTSVSANGNVTFEYEQDQKEEVQEEENVTIIKSPAMKSLTKRIHHYTPNSSPQVVTNHNMDELTEDEVMNPTQTSNMTTPTVSMTNTEDDEEDEKSILSHKSASTNMKTEIISSSTSPLILPTCENNSTLTTTTTDQPGNGFWSWLGFHSSENVQQIPNNTADVQQQKDTIPQQMVTSHNDTTTTSTTTAIATATTIKNDEVSVPSPASSWMSFLFTTSNKPTIETTVKQPKPTIKPSPSILEDDTNSIRKVKSTSSLPTTKPAASDALRNSTSISSLNNIIRKKNQVLPPFHSQFTVLDVASPVLTSPTSNNLLSKAMDALNAILVPSSPEQPPEDTSNWIAKRMRTKFSNFIDEVKAFSTSDPAKKAMMNKRIVIVGVHGWFPMKLVRSMIGEPTGTSIKFCEQMAAAVKLYFESEHQVTLPSDAITLVPLEGEGKVEDRVNHLYARLLENSEWLEAVSSADVVLWATHSQGTPVSMILLQRLLERGHIHIIRQSVCVLAMAGISHGPFPALKGSLIVKYFEADPARELFEFMDSTSSISVKYRQSLAYILKCGIKVVLMGSMQDQVVPLYSAIMSYVNHPNLLRSIYIDGHIYSDDDFLINLVVFALKLRNTGLSDHHLLTYLSEVLAGSLYALEGGHSTIYEELEVYMTAVRYTFETAPFGKFVRNQQPNTTPTSNNSRKQSAASSSLMAHMTSATADIEEAHMEPFQAKLQQNPFYIPWALHGIFCDPLILADEVLKSELKRLRSLFDQWNPTSGRLKELKFRLDPLKTVNF